MPVKSIRFPNQTTYDGKITSLTEKEKEVLKKAGIGGGESNINILTGSQPEETDKGYHGTYSGVPDESKINILHIENFADFVITLSMGGYYSGYVNVEGTKFIISLLEGEYTIEAESESNKNPINVITIGDKDNTFNGTLVSPGLTLFSYKFPNVNSYQTMPIYTNGAWGTSLTVNDEIGEMTVYTFYQFNKRYGTVKYYLKYYSHFITMTDSSSNIALYLTIQNNSVNEFNWVSLGEYLTGKKVLANGNLHGVVPTYIAGEGGVINVHYMTPGDSNINPQPDEFADLSSFEISDTVKPVE